MADDFTIKQPSDAFGLLARIKDYFERGGKKPLIVTVKSGSGKSRSDKENRYYHGVVVQGALEHYAQHPMDLIRDVLDAVGANITPEFIHELIKLRFGVKSTAKLDTTGFEELMLRLRQHFAELGTDIKEPREGA
jgi:hypothetical protein